MKLIGDKFGQFLPTDFLRALWVFLISTILSFVGDAILQAISTGDYHLATIHWKAIGGAIAVSVISELKKSFLTNSEDKFFKREPPKTD